MQPTDEQLRYASPAERAYWLRIYRLVAESGCTVEVAIAAVADADAHPSR